LVNGLPSQIFSHYTALTSAPLASCLRSDYFSTGDTDVPVCQRVCSRLLSSDAWPMYPTENISVMLHVYLLTTYTYLLTSRSVFLSVYRRAALVSCSCFRSLEFSTIAHSVITFFNCFPSPAKDISLSQIIPPHSIVLPYTLSWSQ